MSGPVSGPDIADPGSGTSKVADRYLEPQAYFSLPANNTAFHSIVPGNPLDVGQQLINVLYWVNGRDVSFV